MSNSQAVPDRGLLSSNDSVEVELVPRTISELPSARFTDHELRQASGAISIIAAGLKYLTTLDGLHRVAPGLRSLDVSGCGLSTPLFNQITQWSPMQRVNASSNPICALPDDPIGMKNSMLAEIVLSSCNLGKPSSATSDGQDAATNPYLEHLRKYSGLRRVNLSSNPMLGSSQIGMQSLSHMLSSKPLHKGLVPLRLRSLNLSNCSLSVVPDELADMPSLESLILSGNSIRDLPVFLMNLKVLRDLDVSRNQLVVAPVDALVQTPSTPWERRISTLPVLECMPALRNLWLGGNFMVVLSSGSVAGAGQVRKMSNELFSSAQPERHPRLDPAEGSAYRNLVLCAALHLEYLDGVLVSGLPEASANRSKRRAR